jgi:hypothetical protein
MRRIAVTIGVLIIIATSAVPASGIVGRPTVVREFVELLAGKSVTKIGSATMRESVETMSRLSAKYGDNVYKVVDDAGFGLLKATSKHGDEVIEIAMKTSPEAAEFLGRNADEMLPHIRRYGVEYLEIEAKSPGMATKAFAIFGDDAGKSVAKAIPAEDLPRFLKYASSADSPKAREALLQAYKKGGRGFLERLSPKQIMATGLSISMITVAASGGVAVMDVADGVSDTVTENKDVARTFIIGGWAMIGSVILFIVAILLWRFGLMPWHRKPKQNVVVKATQDDVSSNTN